MQVQKNFQAIPYLILAQVGELFAWRQLYDKMQKREDSHLLSWLVMQLRGLEPLPKYMDMNLNHARMPIPPQLLIRCVACIGIT